MTSTPLLQVNVRAAIITSKSAIPPLSQVVAPINIGSFFAGFARELGPGDITVNAELRGGSLMVTESGEDFAPQIEGFAGTDGCVPAQVAEG